MGSGSEVVKLMAREGKVFCEGAEAKLNLLSSAGSQGVDLIVM